MNGHDLVIQIKELQTRLDKTLIDYATWGKNRAKAEYDYRVAYRKQILVERSNGQPTTIIEALVRGDEEIAKLRMNRDVTDTMYRAALEHINAVKLEMRIIQDMIEREYNRA